MSSVQSTSLLYTWYFKALQTRRPVKCIKTLSFSKPGLERGSYLSVHFSIGCNMAQVRFRRRREAKQTKSRKFQSERIASVLRDRVVMIPKTTQTPPQLIPLMTNLSAESHLRPFSTRNQHNSNVEETQYEKYTLSARGLKSSASLEASPLQQTQALLGRVDALELLV